MIYYFEPNSVVQYLSKRDEDAGYDLYANMLDDPLFLPKKTISHVKTGLHVKIPDGYVGIIKERSSYPFKKVRFSVRGGVIDSGYSGEIIVFLENTSDTGISLPSDKAIAQLVVVPIYDGAVHHCHSRDLFMEHFAGKKRLDGRAGSTGK